MIISHKYKFIFIKSNKTAGTSLEIALSKFCGDEDILTPIHQDENIRKELGYKTAQNYVIPYRYYTFIDFLRLIFQFKKKKYWEHMTSLEIKNNVEPYIWDNYFKFTIERNPYDRVISHYYWKYQNEPRPSLLDHLMSKDIMNLKQWGYNSYTIEHKIVVDKILKYEDLPNELNDLKDFLDLEEDIVMPKTKHNIRKNKSNKFELIGQKEKKIIDNIFKKEFKLFDYNNDKI